MVLSKLAQEVSRGLVATIKGTDDVLAALRGAVKNQITGVLNDVTDISTAGVDAVSDVAKGSISAAEKVISQVSSLGLDVTQATKEAVLGVVKGADEVSEEVGKNVRDALLSAVTLPRDIVEK